MHIKAILELTPEDIEALIEEALAGQGYSVHGIDGLPEETVSVRVAPLTPEEKHTKGMDHRTPEEIIIDGVKDIFESYVDQLTDGAAQVASSILEEQAVQEDPPDVQPAPAPPVVVAPVTTSNETIIQPRKPSAAKLAERDRKIAAIRAENAAAPDPYAHTRDDDGFVN